MGSRIFKEEHPVLPRKLVQYEYGGVPGAWVFPSASSLESHGHVPSRWVVLEAHHLGSATVWLSALRQITLALLESFSSYIP